MDLGDLCGVGLKFLLHASPCEKSAINRIPSGTVS
jgi:hypothetical protein